MEVFYNELKCYKSDQIMCQKYLGPPNWYQGPEPEHLTEIFLSNLGRDITEFQVYELCRSFGHIYQIRLPVTFADSKGFAYCRFFDKQFAADAITALHDSTFRGRKIKASLSMDTRVIQIMGLPNWPETIIRHHLQNKIEKATSILINIKFNFALVTFGSHNEAQVCIRELKKNPEFGRVQWARGDSDLPEEYFQTVKELYVGHVPDGTTHAELRAALSGVLNAKDIVKIHHSGCYGFIYFGSHAEAEKTLLCLRASNITIRGQAITFNWLKGEYSKRRSDFHGSLKRFDNRPVQNCTNNTFTLGVKLEPDDDEMTLTLDRDNFDRAPGAERAGRRTRVASQDSGIGWSQPRYF